MIDYYYYYYYYWSRRKDKDQRMGKVIRREANLDCAGQGSVWMVELLWVFGSLGGFRVGLVGLSCADCSDR